MNNLALNNGLLTLPSRGKETSYDGKLVGDGAVKLRPLVMGDQRAIATVGDPYQMYSVLVGRVLQDPQGTSAFVDEMLTTDATAVIIGCRIMSFGHMYRTAYQCSECNARNDVEVNLLELETQYSEEIDGYQASGIEFQVGDVTITYRLAKVDDEKQAQRYLKEARRRNTSVTPQDATYVKIAHQIENISALSEGQNKSLQEKLKYLESLSWSDYAALVTHMNDHTPGVVARFAHTCTSCHWDDYHPLEFGKDFFRS